MRQSPYPYVICGALALLAWAKDPADWAGPLIIMGVGFAVMVLGAAVGIAWRAIGAAVKARVKG
jgi:hypothetical protein